jgi:PTH1 family peptidyl-tRNA hydrolase
LKLVVGLGNPGRRYARSRHNAGFRVTSRFAAECGIALDREDFGGLFGRGELACAGAAEPLEVAVLQPLTFMNLSGDAVAEAVASLPIPEPERDLLVVSDDVDLPFGRLRLRAAGGPGGQKGLAHIIERLGHPRFPRLRFGVGRPRGDMQTADHVLESFSSEEEGALPALVARAAEAVARTLCEGVESAMNSVNRDPDPPDEAPDRS